MTMLATSTSFFEEKASDPKHAGFSTVFPTSGSSMMLALDGRGASVYLGRMTTFSRWMQSHGMSQSDVASKLGVTRQAVHVWSIGRSPPSLYHALALEALSGGAVTAESWLSQTKQLALKALRGETPVVPVVVEAAPEKPAEEPADEVLYSS